MLIALRLPGREARIRETPLTRLDDITKPLARALEPLRDVPLVMFGHSFGSLVGFELCRALRAAGFALPKQLIVSGRNAPGHGRTYELHSLSDKQLVDEVQRPHQETPVAHGNREWVGDLVGRLRLVDRDVRAGNARIPDEICGCGPSAEPTR